MNNETFTSITQMKGKQVYIPSILLKAAGITEGDYIEVTIRRLDPIPVKNPEKDTMQ